MNRIFCAKTGRNAFLTEGRISFKHTTYFIKMAGWFDFDTLGQPHFFSDMSETLICTYFLLHFIGL